MADKRPSAAAPILVALLVLSALTVPYVAGYFWLSTPLAGLGAYERQRVVRLYKSWWAAEIFRPAAMVESAVSPNDVTTAVSSQ